MQPFVHFGRPQMIQQNVAKKLVHKKCTNGRNYKQAGHNSSFCNAMPYFYEISEFQAYIDKKFSFLGLYFAK